MGFFDKLFGGKHDAAPKFAGEKMTVMAPIDGKVIPLEQIPDETFATAILGPGCGIEPTGDTVYAPFDGTITQVASTLHAIGITSDGCGRSSSPWPCGALSGSSWSPAASLT